MKISIQQFQVVVLWVIVLIGMILHFNYHVSKIFYGIDVARPGSDRTISPMVHVVRAAFYHLPMIFIALLLFIEAKWFRLAMFVISIPYTISHVGHVLKEFQKPAFDWSQIVLLSLILVLSIVLNVASWNYFAAKRNAY